MNQIEAFRGDDGTVVLNASNVSTGDISQAMAAMGDGADPMMNRVIATMGSWARESKPTRLAGLFDRDRYVTPTTTFDKIRTARRALTDDVIGGAADVTESLALASLSIYAEDSDEEDIWNQWAADIDLDSRMREAWRILLTDSSFVVAAWWERKSYTVRGTTKKDNKRRKTFDITVPGALSFIDTTKIAPVGSLMFGKERLAYIANPVEADAFDEILGTRDRLANERLHPVTVRVGMLGNPDPNGGIDPIDPVVERLLVGRYKPTDAERIDLSADGINTDNLFLLDNRFVFRHTLTRPTYQRFSDVRLESTFGLLDLKAQLRQMDRAFLIGGTNYLVVITKGSDQIPATQPEITNLRSHVQVLAQMPVIVGDHRLHVEIVTPKVDLTLDKKKYDTLDARLTARVYGTFAVNGDDAADPIKLGRIIGRGLEGRRRMIRRALESNLFQPIRDSNDDMKARAKLMYHPASVSLAFDAGWATLLLDLRASKEISRDTLLSQFDMDQADEAAQREREAEDYDEIFNTIVPYGANPINIRKGIPLIPGNPVPGAPGDPNDPNQQPDPGAQRLATRQGGRQGGGNRNGGGAAPGTGQGQETRKPRKQLLKSYEDLVADMDGMDRDALIAEAGRWGIPGRHRMRKEHLRTSIEHAAADDEESTDD